jgi:hypothetical protein
MERHPGVSYAASERLGCDLRHQGQLKWKHAMRLIQLLLSGIGSGFFLASGANRFHN